jgi:hypothetical protein
MFFAAWGAFFPPCEGAWRASRDVFFAMTERFTLYSPMQKVPLFMHRNDL